MENIYSIISIIQLEILFIFKFCKYTIIKAAFQFTKVGQVATVMYEV